ncbi:MAG TPA: RNA 2',3'-cyclic phosphodiesterase [Candidatus Aquilonibacter sp.]|nr:RNA 2',3'-cyclic phosphodiesterase [Candidatus Aquilonibacter sp.]
MRLFVGLAIGRGVKESLERLTLRLRAKDDGLRWSTPDQWHVTLVFVGDVDDAGRARLVRELGVVRQPELELHMEQAGVFERSGIFFAEVEVTDALRRLYEAVAEAARRCGLAVEERPYRAHITLARARNRDGRKSIERLKRAAVSHRLRAKWSAKEFLLYESQLSPGGSRYVVRERFPLVLRQGRDADGTESLTDG